MTDNQNRNRNRRALEMVAQHLPGSSVGNFKTATKLRAYATRRNGYMPDETTRLWHKQQTLILFHDSLRGKFLRRAEFLWRQHPEFSRHPNTLQLTIDATDFPPIPTANRNNVWYGGFVRRVLQDAARTFTRTQLTDVLQSLLDKPLAIVRCPYTLDCPIGARRCKPECS